MDLNNTNTSLDIRKPLYVGLSVLGFFLLGFVLWSVLAPLESAAIAPGKVVVSGDNKVIQHLEGGIVEKIYIKEGAHVKKGEKLLELDDTQAGANLELLQSRYNALTALETRLEAERDEKDTVTFPLDLIAQSNDPEVFKLIQVQKKEFETRKAALDNTTAILLQRKKQFNDEIISLEHQIGSDKRQLELVDLEVEATQYLADRKLIPLSRLYALQREQARLAGDRDEKVALIARTKQKIGETDLQILQQRNQVHTEVLMELRDTHEKLGEIDEQLSAAKDVHHRTIIYAPQSGIVTGLAVHTVGGVVRPGETLMTIVPSLDKLVIEVRIDPLDIDVVKKGLTARVTLSAFKARDTPTLTGTVNYVSGDAFTDEQTGLSYYLARITMDDPEKSMEGYHLYPGMPVQAMINTGTQSLFRYLISPIKDSLDRAFREQ